MGGRDQALPTLPPCPQTQDSPLNAPSPGSLLPPPTPRAPPQAGLSPHPLPTSPGSFLTPPPHTHPLVYPAAPAHTGSTVPSNTRPDLFEDVQVEQLPRSLVPYGTLTHPVPLGDHGLDVGPREPHAAGRACCGEGRGSDRRWGAPESALGPRTSGKPGACTPALSQHRDT